MDFRSVSIDFNGFQWTFPPLNSTKRFGAGSCGRLDSPEALDLLPPELLARAQEVLPELLAEARSRSQESDKLRISGPRSVQLP